jgi:IclR family transcriptional regulator, acetate operon repressor
VVAVTLGVPANDQVVTVAQVEGNHFVSSGSWIGVHTPLHCAADGEILLAFDGVRPASGKLVARTERTIRDRGALARELAAVRRRGFATARGELEAGLVGIAAPVRDGGSCIAAMCLSGPEYRLDAEATERLVPRCRERMAH